MPTWWDNNGHTLVSLQSGSVMCEWMNGKIKANAEDGTGVHFLLGVASSSSCYGTLCYNSESLDRETFRWSLIYLGLGQLHWKKPDQPAWQQAPLTEEATRKRSGHGLPRQLRPKRVGLGNLRPLISGCSGWAPMGVTSIERGDAVVFSACLYLTAESVSQVPLMIYLDQMLKNCRIWIDFVGI